MGEVSEGGEKEVGGGAVGRWRGKEAYDGDRESIFLFFC